MTQTETRQREKQLLRQEIRRRKSLHSPRQLSAWSLQSVERLEHHPRFIAAGTVLLYHSLPDEVDTLALLSRYAAQKRILLPTVVGNDLQLHVYNEGSPVASGPFGIVESQDALFTDYGSIDLAVIPGLAFDSQGNRLGRGRGYYDRLLPHLRCHTIGIGFPFQLVDHIPTDEHDIPLDEVIC